MRAKRKLRRQFGTSRDLFPSYIHEFVFRNLVKNSDVFSEFLVAVNESYPVQALRTTSCPKLTPRDIVNVIPCTQACSVYMCILFDVVQPKQCKWFSVCQILSAGVLVSYVINPVVFAVATTRSAMAVATTAVRVRTQTCFGKKCCIVQQFLND